MPKFVAVIKGLRRLINEKFDDYRNRLGAEQEALKRYLRGRFTTLGKRYVPKKEVFLSHPNRTRHNYKKKIKARARRRMQKLSRRRNRRAK